MEYQNYITVASNTTNSHYIESNGKDYSSWVGGLTTGSSTTGSSMPYSATDWTISYPYSGTYTSTSTTSNSTSCNVVYVKEDPDWILATAATEDDLIDQLVSDDKTRNLLIEGKISAIQLNNKDEDNSGTWIAIRTPEVVVKKFPR